MSRFEQFLRRHVRYEEIGWKEIGEHFTRFVLAKTPWFNIYLHRLDARTWHPECHDHPWGFVAILLKNGYLERAEEYEWDEMGVGGGPRCVIREHRRRPGSILFRPATFLHNVITPYGVSWSIIFTTRKTRDWGFQPCDRSKSPLPWDLYRATHRAKRML